MKNFISTACLVSFFTVALHASESVSEKLMRYPDIQAYVTLVMSHNPHMRHDGFSVSVRGDINMVFSDDKGTSYMITTGFNQGRLASPAPSAQAKK